MKPSPRQVAVYDAWKNTKDNLLIEAVAGSGKTTVLLHLLKNCDDSTCFLAFNKSIKKEIEGHIFKHKIPNAKALTMHSLGLMAIKQKWDNVIVDNSKYYNIVDYIKKNNPYIFDPLKKGDKYKLTQMLSAMNNVSRIYLINDVDEIKLQMVANDNIIFESKYIDVLWNQLVEIRDESYEMNEITIDFTDMIYLTVKYDLEIPIEPKYLMIDEAQDLNMSQHIMIDKILSQGKTERWVSVGDRNQSIYGFSGAHATSFDLFKDKENVLELPLDICYRCPSDIIKEANNVYDVMQGFKKDKGIVEFSMNSYKIKPESMVVCRNTAPLLDLYFKIVSDNKPVYLKGDDILNRIKTFINQFRFDTIAQMMGKVGLKAAQLKESGDPIDYFQSIKMSENLDFIKIMVEANFIRTNEKGSDLIDKLATIFKETDNAIILCTIHKAKGLESDVVYILDDNLIPSEHAKSPAQLVQEENLRYVAITRAKKELHYLYSKKVHYDARIALEAERVKETKPKSKRKPKTKSDG